MRLALILTPAAFPFMFAYADPPAPVDPLPLRRILVTPERVAAELDRVRQGVLVQLPRPEFEALVRQAAAAGERLKTPPRLAEARYWARLEGTNLVGSGDWTVINPTRMPGILALPDINLALSRVKVGAADALLGDLEGKTLGLLVEGAGEQSVFFDWSVRGGQGVGGLHFELQVPPCAVASLELTLPEDCTVSVSHSVAVLSGPHDAGDVRQRLWRLRFSGRSAVDLIVRKPDAPDQTKPLLVATLATTQELTPARVRADFDFQVEVLHHPTEQLVFDLDPLLEPYDVTVRNFDLKEWRIQQESAPRRAGKPPPPATRRSLVVALREPFQGMLPPLRVRCLAHLPADKPWTSPWMRVRDAAVQGETLTLKVHPDVRLENWQAGNFRLMGTSTEEDGAQVLTLLAGTAAAAPAALPRPAARVKTQGVEFLARQRTWWQIGPQGSSLTAQITYEVSRGSLIELPVALPAGWQVEEVSFEPKGWLRNWIPVQTANRLVVELHHALRPRQQAQLTVRLHSPQGRDVARGGKAYTFPEVAPQDPCVRESTLAISVDPLFQGTVPRASVPTTLPDAPGPWGQSVPTFSFNARNQSVTGLLRLVPRAATLRATCHTEVVLAPSSAGISARLELEPLAGAADAIDLQMSAPVPGRWEWKSVSQPDLVRSLERLPPWGATPYLLALGARNGVTAAGILTLPPVGERWRLTFSRPLARRETLTLHATLVQEVGQQLPGWHWQLPVVTVPTAAWLDGEVILHLSGTELTDVRTSGLREDERGTSRKGTAGTGPGEASVARVYHYGNAYSPAEFPVLVVHGRVVPADRAAREVCDHARLVTHVEPRGRLLHHFSFRVWNWRQHVVPVRLPSGSQVLAARVDGRWVRRLTAAETGEGVQLALPVAAGESLHRLEIVYSSALDWPAWALGAALEVPAPQLPVTPVSFRRTWCLPPGVAPLTEGRVHRLPDPLSDNDPGPWWDMPRRTWQSGTSWLAALDEQTAAGEWSSRQRQVLEAAETGMRPQATVGKKETLGTALDRLAVTLSRENVGLVVDGVALRTAKLGPGTPLSPLSRPGKGSTWQPFWEGLGLVYVPAHGAALLTTRRQWEAWQAAAGRGDVLSATLDEAVREAALQGHDRWGRFCAVPAWVRGPTSAEGSAMDVLPTVLADECADSFGARWTEWEPVAGSTAPQELSVVRHDAVRVLGWALAGLLALLAWRGRHGLAPRWRFRLLILWLASAGLAVLWLPAGLRIAAWGPALTGFGVALVWYGRWGTTATTPRPQPSGDTSNKKRLTAEAAATAVVLALLTALAEGVPPVQSGAPDPATVLLVPAGQPGSGQQTALVTPELLRRLEELAQRGAAGLRGVVPVSAAYEGKLTGTVAQFRAEFQVFNFADRGTLTLALGGVELAEGALVDGAAAYPVAREGARMGYTLEIAGRGAHTISLPFTARVVETADHTDLAFTVPRLAQSRLLLALPAGVQSPTVLSALGAQRAGAAETGLVRVEADLGRESAVHVRWLAASRSPRTVKLQVREAYLWDLSQPVPSLTGVLHYLPRNGAAGHFAIRLPEGIDVRSVEVRQEGAAPVNASVARLKTWQVTGSNGNRLLQVELQNPITSAAQVTLGLVPRLAVGPKTLLLALPTPVGAQPTEGFLAYRAPSWETLDRAQYLGVTNIPGRTFLQVWGAAGMSDLTEPTRAYTFRRTPGGTSALGLVLQAPRPRLVQEVSWKAQPGYADVQARAELQTAGKDLILVEWIVPEKLIVADVQGEDVRHWSRAANRVQVWLRTAKDRTTVELNGWVAFPPARQGRLDVLSLGVVGAKVGNTTVRVTPAPGVIVQPEQVKNLVPIPGQGAATALTYLAKQLNYKGEFRIRPAPVQLRVRALLRAALSDHTLDFVAHVAFPVRAGPAQTLTLRLRHWEGEEVHLEAPGASHRREQRPGSTERTWTVTLPAGASRVYHMKLLGKQALDPVRKPLMPDVTVAGALPVDRWVAVTGGDLSAEDGHGLALVKDVAGTLPWWPAEAETLRREGTVWKVLAGDWRLRLAAASAATVPPVQVVSAEQAAALGDGRRWVHQAAYCLLVRGPSDLRLKLPPGARVLSVTLDGKALLPRQPTSESLWVTQLGTPGPHTLRLRWLLDRSGPSFAQPDLTEPRFEGLAMPAAVWTVHVPTGYEARLDGQGHGLPIGAAEVELRRAEALVKLSSLLAPRQGAIEPVPEAQLADAQRRFYGHLRRAEYATALTAGDARPALSARLQQLRKDNARMAEQHGLEKLRAAAEKQPWDGTGDAGALFFALPQQGTPRYYLADASGQTPQLLLTATAPRQFSETLNASEILLIFLAGVVLLSYAPRVTEWIRRLWPEQLLLLAWLGCQAFGVSPLGMVLIVVGVIARVVLLAGWVQGRWQASGPPARMGSSIGSAG